MLTDARKEPRPIITPNINPDVEIRHERREDVANQTALVTVILIAAAAAVGYAVYYYSGYGETQTAPSAYTATTETAPATGTQNLDRAPATTSDTSATPAPAETTETPTAGSATTAD